MGLKVRVIEKGRRACIDMLQSLASTMKAWEKVAPSLGVAGSRKGGFGRRVELRHIVKLTSPLSPEALS